ncbi:translation initiation factor IF-3 [Candidatus Shapirobacteria bacterium]|nr:translation initiation factor IF-3 [Candidatus Shapirobacteria bacterium]
MGRRKYTKTVFYRTNWQIRALTVRLINQKGKQIGVFSLADARKKAQEEQLDLVEIAPKASPPVVKLIDFDKFKYQEAKKQKEEKKKQAKGIKEIQATPFIEEQDLQVRLKRAERFLKKGYRVRLVIKFLGRQITQKSFGYDLINKIAENISDFGELEEKPRLRGKRLIVFFKPKKSDEQKKKENKEVSRQPVPNN